MTKKRNYAGTKLIGRVAVFTMAVLLSASVQAAEVVTPRHSAVEVVVADCVLEPLAGETNAAPRIQQAIDALLPHGGTLFLSAGTYPLATPIRLRPNVTLKGDYGAKDLALSTVLAITGGCGEENAPATIQMDTSSGLQGLVFYYPDQKLEAPVAYPWTVRCLQQPTSAPDNQTIRDCTFVNAWQAIAIGPEPNELHTLRDVRICALKTGFHIDITTDIGRVIDVTVSPSVWSSSGFPNAPRESDLRTYLHSHETIGADYVRSDWEYIWRLKVDGYAIGCRFSRGIAGDSTAVMDESRFSNCGTCLEVNELTPFGLSVYDTKFTDSKRSVYLSPRFTTVAQFLACTFACGQPVNEGSKASFVQIRDGISKPVRHQPMVFPRPPSEALFDVTQFGAATNLTDNAPAFQRALDAARAAGGGTVYVPGGWYDFRSSIIVPKGVELRGSSASPHHTGGGGSVLMVRCGKGSESGTPLIRLEPGSGLRGLLFWYPENPINNPVAYPWTIRSLGPDCWLVDVTVSGAWQAVDFATFPSTGHRISYLAGDAWRTMLSVGHSAGPGWVEETLFNPHNLVRLPAGFPTVRASVSDPDYDSPNPRMNGYCGLLRKRLEAHVFTDCADERIRGTFVYGAHDGLAFRGRNQATLVMHGTDTAPHGVELDQSAESQLSAALVMLTPWETRAGDESAGFYFAPTDRGQSVFRASLLWVENPTVVGEGHGNARFEMGASLSGPAELRSGNFSFTDFVFTGSVDEPFNVSPQVHFEEQHSGLPPITPSLLPTEPLCALTLGSPEAPFSVNTICPSGGCHGEGAWFARPEGEGEFHYKAELIDNAYAFVYAEVVKNIHVPIYPQTRFSYRIYPISSDLDACTIAFDFHFTDGEVMRVACPVWPSRTLLKKGEWHEIVLPMRKLVGRTIDSVMLRVDERDHAKCVYEALFDRISFK